LRIKWVLQIQKNSPGFKARQGKFIYIAYHTQWLFKVLYIKKIIKIITTVTIKRHKIIKY